MTRLIILFLLLCCGSFVIGQYATPGTGVHWNMDSLVLYSGGVVTEAPLYYAIHEDLIISPNDSLVTLTQSMSFAPAVVLTIEGYSSIGGFGPVLTSLESDEIYAGVRIEEGAEAIFDFVRFEGGGGVKCISGDVTFTHCEFIQVQHIATNNAALELFSGSPIINECLFEASLGSAISSPANVGCGPEITDNVFIGNNTENTNRPQINLGPSTDLFQIQISGNQIEGNPDLTEVGGIACISFFGDPTFVNILGNEIVNNRYGLTLSGGGFFGYIYDNLFMSNNTQNEPLLGGSGINLNGPASNFVEIQGNVLDNNLWGITVQGEFGVGLGLIDSIDGSLGFNVFDDNGNGGQTYALFNNTPNPISAQNNCWIAGQESTAAEIEQVISHQVDDNSLGLVDFSDYLCGTVGIAEEEIKLLDVFPNPANDLIKMDNPDGLLPSSIMIYSSLGQVVLSSSIDLESIDISTLPSGRYTLEVFYADDKIRRAHFIKD